MKSKNENPPSKDLCVTTGFTSNVVPIPVYDNLPKYPEGSKFETYKDGPRVIAGPPLCMSRISRKFRLISSRIIHQRKVSQKRSYPVLTLSE